MMSSVKSNYQKEGKIQRYTQNILRIFEGYTEDIRKIYAGYTEDIRKIYARYTEDIRKIYAGYTEKQMHLPARKLWHKSVQIVFDNIYIMLN